MDALGGETKLHMVSASKRAAEGVVWNLGCRDAGGRRAGCHVVSSRWTAVLKRFLEPRIGVLDFKQTA